MAPKHSKLFFRYELIIKEINALQKNVNECENNIIEIEFLKSKIENFEKSLEHLFSELTENECDEKFEEYIKTKDKLFTWKVNICNKLPRENKNNDAMQTQNSNSFINLPKISVPHFYGNSEEWISFKEIFQKSILENESLNEIQKLTYLQSCVRGEAAKLIRGFPITEENLKNCWEILIERFENKRQLAITHINKIFNMKITKAVNSKSLLEIIDVCNEALRNLKTLGLETNKLTDLILINFLTSKLDENTTHRWELGLQNNSFPTLEDFKVFIEHEARSAQKLVKPENKKIQGSQNKSGNNFNFIKKSSVNGAIVKENKVNTEIKNNDSTVKGDLRGYNSCILCPGQIHSLYKCPVFNAMNINERWNTVNNNKLCENCLRKNHQLQSCRIGIGCKNCSARHHTLLHNYSTGVPDTPPTQNFTVSNTNTTVNCDNNVLLSTAIIHVKDKFGKFITCKALIDSASQHSLISESTVKLLNLPTVTTNHKLIGINDTYAETSLSSTNLEFKAYFSNEIFNVKALVVKKVTTSLPNFMLKNTTWSHTQNLILADPSFFKKSDIQILLGADIFLSLIDGPPILGPKGTPSALPTKLGHLLSGIVKTAQSHENSIMCHTICTEDSQLKEFWELESVNQNSIKLNDEEELCENIFANTHSRNAEGRYIVKLPFKEDQAGLGDSKQGALQRFYSLERKLNCNEDFRNKYVQFIKEYINLNHMTLIKSDIIAPNYFLPHHGVLNESSSTTKLRVVFDGSFKSSNQKSLNDILLTGKKLQADIFTILFKFRLFPIAFCADITKMYRQILIAPEDTPYQCIFWRESNQHPLSIYMLNTVTYGTVSAPYLAMRTIKQLCIDEQTKFPNAAKIAQEHFYVDDLLAGAETVESTKLLIKELLDLMDAGGFELRKWSCSHPEALVDLPENLTATNLSHSFENDSQKILGLYWNLKLDAFQVRTIPSENVSTKRQLLSVIARIFDPLGFIAPSTIILKIMLQDLWKSKLGWDDNLPTDILNKWNKFYAEIDTLKDIIIPRYIDTLHSSNFEIHGFCDASLKAYAAVIYIRVKSYPARVFLATAKTRVAPVQQQSLPRLELCGALLLSELLQKVKEAIKVQIPNLFLWTDSTITLNWINNPPIKGNQFVLHRVNKILSLTAKHNWHHIPGKSNVADCASRGLYPKQLLVNTEWFNGPNWLYDFEPNSINETPSILNIYDSVSDNNHINSFITTTIESQTTDPSEFMSRFSSYLKLIRTVAWIFRFSHNAKGTIKHTGPLQTSEINNSIQSIVKTVQQFEFKNEIKSLKENKPLCKSSKLVTLNPFLDQDEILRVGGRLRHQKDLSFNQKFPMIIPKDHHITILIIRHFHITNLHAGQELVLSLIRQQFWIPDGKSTVRKELRNCVSCYKVNARPILQIMGDLPPQRINPCRVFQQVGVDFAGPITTKCQHSRKATTFKSYLCIFVCMCTKAIHLEVVSSLSSAAFLAAFRRFVSRRGYPSDVYSDNGKNFVGTASYLNSLYKILKDESIQNYSTQFQIRWHFIPPYTPNFGGLWEAAVKITKRHIVKACGSALLNFEELSTLLCQIEGCINSRPLYPLSPDKNDTEILTPGHFLIGCPLLQLPDSDSNTNPIFLSSHSRWKLIQKMKKQFWDRWSLAYLHTLQPRTKWLQKHHQILPGALVLLKDPTSHATCWSLARIIDVHPGSDGVIRVVTVKTVHGTTKRAVSQLAILPTNELDVTSRAGRC